MASIKKKVGKAKSYTWFIALMIIGTAFAIEVQEVTQGTAEKIFFEVKNSTGGAETGATCTVDVWYENSTQIATDLPTAAHPGGAIYHFNTSATWQASRMQAEVGCSSSEGYLSTTGIEFEVVQTPLVDKIDAIQTDIGDPSAAGTSLYAYMVNSLKSALDTLISRLGIPSDYGYNNISALLNRTLENQQNKLITVAGTVTDANGASIDGAAVDVGVQSCSDVGVCTPTVIGGYAETTSSNGRYDLQFTRNIVPGQLYRVNTTIYSGASVTTTFSYFTN